MISPEYEKTLKRRAIESFVKDNKRSPSRIELQDLMIRAKRNHPSIDQIGFVGQDIYKPQFRDISSAEKENKTRKAIHDDLFTISDRLNSLSSNLEDSYQGLVGNVLRTNKLLKQIESRVDNLLLLNEDVDVFVYGAEETFDSQALIDFNSTTAAVEPGYVTLGRTGLSIVDMGLVNVSATAVSENGIIGSEVTNSIDVLKEMDGKSWQHLVYTKQKQGRVSTIIEFQMPEPLYVGDFKFACSAISVNAKQTASLFYSLDGQTFTHIDPVEDVINNGEMSFNVGIDNVRKLQLVLSKNAADNETTSRNQYVYVFALDSVAIYSNRYTDNKESLLVAGPYSVFNEEGIPVNFNKAKFSACVFSPENTSVNFYLSKDKVNWQYVAWDDETLSIASFGNSNDPFSSGYIDEAVSDKSLVDSVATLDEVDFATEALLNQYIISDFADAVALRSIQIKRNTVDAFERNIRGVTAGWVYNEQTQRYSTTVYVESAEGRVLNCGNTSLFVNGSLASGLVELQQGYSVIETSSSNWIEVPKGLADIKALKQADPLYPYNHKYLIEGYTFPSSFIGESVYNSVDEYFARLLKYVPPETFNDLSDDMRYNFFTVENGDGNLYFKIKVDKTDNSWHDELFEASWLVSSSDDNQIYVKAILSTTDSEFSPKIEDYMIRVI